MKTMKTCKYGCGKMKSGGPVKKVKKMADGGSIGLVGMPQYSSNPRSEQGRILKKGGTAKAKFGAAVNVQRGYPGKIRSAGDQGYTAVGEREPARNKFSNAKMAKGGFPDYSKDGQITQKDILMGKGVIPKAKKGGNWIQGAIKKPGALREQLGVKEGAKIPKAKLAAAAKKGGKLGQRARLAITLSKMRKNKQ